MGQACWWLLPTLLHKQYHEFETTDLYDRTDSPQVPITNEWLLFQKIVSIMSIIFKQSQNQQGLQYASRNPWLGKKWDLLFFLLKDIIDLTDLNSGLHSVVQMRSMKPFRNTALPNGKILENVSDFGTTLGELIWPYLLCWSVCSTCTYDGISQEMQQHWHVLHCTHGSLW